MNVLKRWNWTILWNISERPERMILDGPLGMKLDGFGSFGPSTLARMTVQFSSRSFSFGSLSHFRSSTWDVSWFSHIGQVTWKVIFELNIGQNSIYSSSIYVSFPQILFQQFIIVQFKELWGKTCCMYQSLWIIIFKINPKVKWIPIGILYSRVTPRIIT